MRAFLPTVAAALVFSGSAFAAQYTLESGPGPIGTTDVTATWSYGGSPWAPAWIVQANPRYSTIGSSHWIAPTPNGSGPSYPNGPVTYRTTFFLPAVYANAHIDGSYYADNYATASLNGTVVATQPAGDNAANYGFGGASATPFTASAELHPGVNELTFDGWDLGNPEGVDYAATVTYTSLDSADQCKKGGWQAFGVFKNQGDCVSYVATGGGNAPG